jgi:hypothetical protein
LPIIEPGDTYLSIIHGFIIVSTGLSTKQRLVGGGAALHQFRAAQFCYQSGTHAGDCLAPKLALSSNTPTARLNGSSSVCLLRSAVAIHSVMGNNLCLSMPCLRHHCTRHECTEHKCCPPSDTGEPWKEGTSRSRYGWRITGYAYRGLAAGPGFN